MKFTIAAAVVGTAVAHERKCPFHEFWHRKERNCPLRDDSKIMDNHKFVRQAKRTIWNNVIRGWYGDHRSDLLDEKCMGDWMQPKQEMVHDVMMKFHKKGIWEVSHQEIKDATSNMWDMFLDNIDYCDGYRFIYNNYEWCMNNMETCKFHQGIATRIIEHGFELIGNALQISHTWNTDSTCYDDKQMLNKIGLISEGIT